MIGGKMGVGERAREMLINCEGEKRVNGKSYTSLINRSS